MKRKLSLLITVLVCLTLVFAACEPVDGLDINKVMATNSNLESVEGNLSLNVELVANDELFSLMLEQPMLLGLQQGVGFQGNFKRNNYTTYSVNGELTAANQAIPVALYTNGFTTVFEVEGIERPLYSDFFNGLDVVEEALEHLTDPAANKAINEAIMKYALHNLPNPESIKVERATITVNDVRVNTRHLQVEVHGEELYELLRVYLSELKDDEEGLRETISALYDFLIPVIDASLDAAFEEDNLFWSPRAVQVIKAYLHNKTLVTEFLYTTITEGLDYAVDEYEEFMVMTPEGLQLFSDDTYFKVSMYLNNRNEIVQNEIEFMLAFGGSDGFEFSEPAGIKVTSVEQYWNHNGDVTVDVLSKENGIDLSHYKAEDAVLSAVDGDSVIGQFLTALGLNKKSSMIFLDDGTATFENGHTMYPIYRLSSLLDVETEWSWGDSTSITLTHHASGTSVTLTEGETVMLVNGEPHELPVAPVDSDFLMYVPLRPVAEAFGYDVIWNAENNTIVLEKTYF